MHSTWKLFAIKHVEYFMWQGTISTSLSCFTSHLSFVIVTGPWPLRLLQSLNRASELLLSWWRHSFFPRGFYNKEMCCHDSVVFSYNFTEMTGCHSAAYVAFLLNECNSNCSYPWQKCIPEFFVLLLHVGLFVFSRDVYVTMQITFLTSKSALRYMTVIRQNR